MNKVFLLLNDFKRENLVCLFTIKELTHANFRVNKSFVNLKVVKKELFSQGYRLTRQFANNDHSKETEKFA